MKEGEQIGIDGLKNSAEEIVLEDPGMDGLDIALEDGSCHGRMNNSSKTLANVESMHLMEGHPFRDITLLLHKIPLSYDPSTLETMEWIQDRVITPIDEEIQYIKEMEVARRSLVVSSLLPPISRLEMNEWSKVILTFVSLLLEVQRRGSVFSIVMNIATQVATTIHSISYQPSSSDTIFHPTDAFSVDAVRNQLALLFTAQQSMNDHAYQAILRSCQKKEKLLLFHLDSILSYDRISLQLLLLSSLFLPSLSLSSLQQSLQTFRVQFPEHAVISTSSPPSPSPSSESIFQPLLNCLRTAFLGLQTMKDEELDGINEGENEERLRNYQSAINSAFEALLSKKEPCCVDKQINPINVDRQDTGSIHRAHQMAREEEEGVMYIYQGVSCDEEKPAQRMESSLQYRNRQIQSDLVREVAILQQRRMKSMPVKVIGELPETEEPKPEAPSPSPSLPNLFSYLPKPNVEMERLES